MSKAVEDAEKLAIELTNIYNGMSNLAEVEGVKV
jgi:hypothetical protein